MKSAFLLLSILLSCYTFSQKIVKIDFKNKTTIGQDTLKLKKGDLYKIEINNINQNVYKIEVTNKDTFLSKPLDFSAFSGFSPDAFSSVISSITNTTKSFQGMDINSVNKSFMDDNIERQFKKDTTFISSVSKELETHVKEIKNKVSYWDASLKRSFLMDDPRNIQVKTIDSIITFFNARRDNLIEVETRINENIKIFDAFIETNAEGIKNAELIPQKDKIKKAYTELSKLLKEAQEKVSDKSLDLYLSKFIDVANNSSRTFTTLPLQFTGEQTLLKIKITPHDSASRLPSYSTNYIIDRKNPMYLGIGPGIYFSGLSDERYSLLGSTVEDSVIGYRFVQEKKSKYEAGVSLLAKGGMKPCGKDLFGVHIAMGVGMSLTNPTKPRALYGIGCTIGQRHNLTLDLGGATGYVDVLSNAYDLNDSYSKEPESITVSSLRTSYFVSLGYLFVF